MNRLFISHVASDAHWLVAFKKSLLGYGFVGFLAHQDIEPESDWADKIRDELRNCDALAVFWSDGATTSPWVNQEVGFAMGRGIPVLSAMCGAAPAGLGADRQASLTVNTRLRDQPRQLARAVFRVLKSPIGDRPVVEGLVHAFEQAATFEAATDSINALLDHADLITNDQVARLERTLESNPNCRDSFVGRERLNAIVARRERVAEGGI